jgi:meso-butanediol dehydrogenase/(S,S)-butanediol dehydrogenase/diacetyl reductase
VPAGRYPELKGKVALVTGAGRDQGIGAAICRRFAAEGCRVVVTDVPSTSASAAASPAEATSDDVDGVVARITAAGGTALGLACDVLSEDEISAAVAATVDAYGGLDILVNNAGIGFLMSPLTETSADDWDKVLGVNLRGAFLATKHAARQMIAQGRGGRVVNIASQASKSGFPFAAAYCSSKHGMVGLTRVSAIELGQHAITVNAVCPNHITTGLGAWQNEYFSDALGMTLDEYLDAMRNRIPLGRPGLTEDIAKACAYLCSDEAVYVTGEAINVSGGEEMH